MIDAFRLSVSYSRLYITGMAGKIWVVEKSPQYGNAASRLGAQCYFFWFPFFWFLCSSGWGRRVVVQTVPPPHPGVKYVIQEAACECGISFTTDVGNCKLET